MKLIEPETCRLAWLIADLPCGGGTMSPCTRKRIKASIRREKLRWCLDVSLHLIRLRWWIKRRIYALLRLLG